ncbi:unnamed protein product [Lupinus luteus]|uniref:non-specific serine/threonine protein kinase n=1 Tax=Lupinus luteus TaxID=3873 RepID=A0AAV1VW11_LUPLU
MLFSDKEDYICSNDNHQNSEKKQQLKKENYSVRGRRPRIGFSDSFSTIDILDLGGLDIEVQHQSEFYSSPRTLEPGTPSSRASTSDFEGQQDLRGTNNNQWRQGFFKLLKKGSQMPFHTFHPLKNVPKLTRRKSKRIREDLIPSLSSPALKSSLDNEFCCFKSSWKNFTLSEILAATNDFSHGPSRFSYCSAQGPREKLNWSLRFKIAMGTAEGLHYLHEGCQRRIIHKDIKASNILLSENFEPQISDFGLSKWLPDQWTHHTVSKVEGTFGYLPPEFFMHGIVDEKTDVYAYGVLLLELITGRQALDSSQKSLVMWAKPLLSANNIKELVDPILVDAYDEEQMKLVLKILRGEEESLKMMKERQKSKLQRTYSVELNDAEDYNSTKFLSDRDRFMETILGSNSIKKESNES